MNFSIVAAELLADYRQRAGLSQADAARVTGIGAKSISSFETGQRTNTIKVVQLVRLLNAYGVSLAEFEADLLTARSTGARTEAPRAKAPVTPTGGRTSNGPDRPATCCYCSLPLDSGPELSPMEMRHASTGNCCNFCARDDVRDYAGVE